MYRVYWTGVQSQYSDLTSDIHFCSHFTHTDPTYIIMVFLTANRPKDCQVLYENGTKCSGEYTIYVGPFRKPVNVYCEMNNVAKTGCTVSVTQLKVKSNTHFKNQ